MNIVWKRPDGGVSVTHLVSATDPQNHAAELQQRGDIPADWIAMEFNAALPQSRESRNSWGVE